MGRYPVHKCSSKKLKCKECYERETITRKSDKMLITKTGWEVWGLSGTVWEGSGVFEQCRQEDTTPPSLEKRTSKCLCTPAEGNRTGIWESRHETRNGWGLRGSDSARSGRQEFRQVERKWERQRERLHCGDSLVRPSERDKY